MEQAKEQLDLVMESVMAEFRHFEEEMESMCIDEMDSLVEAAKKSRKMGKTMEKATSFASKMYIEVAINSATICMKSACKEILNEPTCATQDFY